MVGYSAGPGRAGPQGRYPSPLVPERAAALGLRELRVPGADGREQGGVEGLPQGPVRGAGIREGCEGAGLQGSLRGEVQETPARGKAAAVILLVPGQDYDGVAQVPEGLLGAEGGLLGVGQHEVLRAGGRGHVFHGEEHRGSQRFPGSAGIPAESRVSALRDVAVTETPKRAPRAFRAFMESRTLSWMPAPAARWSGRSRPRC
ncbi:MAG: hypothetical protein MZV64_09305 [Ignavibacteriales bacterium]|nr:hypothetical protein [Ignavibacteriales bacterium]